MTPRLTRTILITIALFTIAESAQAERSRPNVVIFFTDDQGTLDAGCYGATDLHTPNIDKLATTGVRFTQAYAHTVCCPARAALLTGRHPQRSGVNSWTQGDMRTAKGINMALEEVTLAEALQPAGYRSALFGKWHLGSHHDYGPLRQGFHEFFGLRDGFIDNYNHYFLHGKGFHDLYEGTAEIWARGEYFPELMTRRALRFIERHREKPFFLYVAFNIPHYPEQPLAEHAKLYEKLPEPRRTYAAAVTTTDHYVGQIVDKLEELGLRDDTMTIFLADNGHSQEQSKIRVDDHNSGLPKGHDYGANGGGGFTGKWRGHKGNFFEGGVRVPAILSYPRKVRAGEVRHQAVTAMDWYPTILELAGLDPVKHELDGRSLLKILDSTDAPEVHDTLYFQWQNRWAVRQGAWKLIGQGGRKDGDKWSAQLFRLDGEKPESKNVFAENPKIVERLHGLYTTWKKDVFNAPHARSRRAPRLSSNRSWKKPATPPAIIFDADMCGAVDDVGALATLHAFADTGEAKILATITNGVDKAGKSGACCDAINTHFGRGSIPVAVGQSRQRLTSHFTTDLATNFQNDSPNDEGLPTAVDTYRRLLRNQPDESVTIVTLGFLGNLARLYDSPPDRHSTLRGLQLVRKKVARIVVMGGDFPEGRDEYNLLRDLPSAMRVINEAPVPVAFVGAELGFEVLSGSGFTKDAKPNPIRRAYELQAIGEKRDSTEYPSWDSIAVAFAVRGPGGLWSVSGPGKVTLRQGSHVVRESKEAWTRFDDEPDGTHFYVRRTATNPVVARQIEAWVTRPAKESK